tara:strand:+ start:114 stop:872 length:759 start_codon:yes stop_codon:yes gene_type:complete
MAFFGANGFATKAIKKIKSQQQDTSNPGHTHSDNNNNETNIAVGQGATAVGGNTVVGGDGLADIARLGGRGEENNRFISGEAQQIGQGMWQGEAMASQRAARQFGRPVANPAENEMSPLSMDPATMKMIAGAVEESQEEYEPMSFDGNAGTSPNNKNGDPKSLFNNKVSDTTFIPKSFKKFRQPKGGGNVLPDGTLDPKSLVYKGTYKSGEYIEESDFEELGGKVNIQQLDNEGVIRKNKKGRMYVVPEKEN